MEGAVAQGLNRLRKKPERKVNSAKDGLAGAKAQLILLILSARLKPCPCYKAPGGWVFPQPVKPSTFCGSCGPAEAVPLLQDMAMELFQQGLKSCPFATTSNLPDTQRAGRTAQGFCRKLLTFAWGSETG